jgi:hypothetical protein
MYLNDSPEERHETHLRENIQVILTIVCVV